MCGWWTERKKREDSQEASITATDCDWEDCCGAIRSAKCVRIIARECTARYLLIKWEASRSRHFQYDDEVSTNDTSPAFKKNGGRIAFYLFIIDLFTLHFSLVNDAEDEENGKKEWKKYPSNDGISITSLWLRAVWNGNIMDDDPCDGSACIPFHNCELCAYSFSHLAVIIS